MSALNAGQGRCLGAARFLIKPVRAVIELGAAPDVLIKTLMAVHHANRLGSTEDFIAVALPTMRMGRSCMLPGLEVELIGSDASIHALLRLEGMLSLQRRGMIEATGIGEVYAEPGMTGAAYVRDRACEKHTPGWLRRSEARAKRRGKPVGKPVTPRGHDLSTLALQYGGPILHVREQIGAITDAPILVSTYGFSAASAPAILPVFPESAREIEDAA